jgi:adenylate cyclase
VVAVTPQAVLVMHPGTEREQLIPIDDHLVVGRVCGGVDDQHRLVLDHDAISRRHLEIRLDTARDCAVVTDFSTNGTRLNGVRIEQRTAIPLRSGDELAVGPIELEFRSAHLLSGCGFDERETVRKLSVMPTVIVVGDIVDFSRISEYTESGTLFQALDRLFHELRALVVQSQGTPNSYPGDALLALWDLEHVAHAPARAVEFALAAQARLTTLAPELPLRDPDGQPVRMGWAVSLGDVAVSALTGAHIAVIGDTANVAFRVAGIAARRGFPDVLVTAATHGALGGAFAYDSPMRVRVKGRIEPVGVVGVRAAP